MSTLTDIGVGFQTDGTLSIDDDKLSTALSNPQNNISRLFVKSADGTIGFGSRLNTLVSGMIFGPDATLNTRIDGINSSIKNINSQLATESQRLKEVEQNYNAQFTALDSLIGSMTATQNYLTQQLASISANSNSSSK
jgi:flagellar hook-associated protein 2